MTLIKDGFFKQTDHKTGDNKYALLGAGGIKEWSSSVREDTLVARDFDGYIFGQLFNSSESEMSSSTDFDRVYVSNDDYIRYKSKANFMAGLDGRWVLKSGDWMDWGAQLSFKGKNGSTSVYSRIGYAKTASGQTMHCINTGGSQADGAFYITSNGSTSNNDTGGLAIDNEGVTIFGAGDAGSNFTGIFRVLNEDSVNDGPQFIVTKSSGAAIKYNLSVGQNTIESSYKLYVNGSSMFKNIVNIDSNTMGAVVHLNFNRANYNYIGIPSGGTLGISINGSGSANTFLAVDSSSTYPGAHNETLNLGTSSYRWKTLYAQTGDFSATTGTAPLTINSTTKVDNLNVDLLDNKHAEDFYWLGRNSNLLLEASTTSHGITPINAFGFRHGYPQFTDPDFNSGNCSVNYYGRGQSTGSISRITDANALTADSNYVKSGNSSGYVLKISNTAVASNNIGGFVQSVNAGDNKIWVQIFRALLPSGATLSYAANSMGTGANVKWLTSNTGTGKWEWYAQIFYNGHGGSFGNFGHMSAYLEGATTSIVWYLSYCNIYEITNGKYDGLRTRYSDQWSSSIDLKIGNTNKPVDGSGNVSWTLTEIGAAAASHTHSNYLFSTQESSAQNNITWAWNYSKTYRRAFIYNNSGVEYSYLFGLSTANTSINGENYPSYGAILKMGYNDTYLRILRINVGKLYKTDGTQAALGSTDGVDWVKISAGYADSAGSATNASKILTQLSSTDANYYLTFVDSNNSTSAYENLYTNDGIFFNPNTRSFSAGKNITFSTDTDYNNQYMYAFGYNNTVQGYGVFAVGHCVKALGDGAHAVGEHTIAVDHSHAEGWYSQALNDFSHAEGYCTTASGEKSHAEGHYSEATRTAAHAEGWGTLSSGLHSHSEGNESTASGEDSHAEGDGTIASGVNSHAEGYHTKATGLNSHSEGDRTEATGNYSHTEGELTYASGAHSHTEGINTIAGGGCSHAEGAGSAAYGLCSHAQGYYTEAMNVYEFACGRYNKSNDGTRFSIGVGNYNNDEGGIVRRNIFEVLTSVDGSSRLYGGIIKIGTEYEEDLDDNYQTRLYVGGCLRLTGAYENTNITHDAKRLIYFGNGNTVYIGEDFDEENSDYDTDILALYGDYGIKAYSHILPSVNNSLNLGSSSFKWKNVYATTFTGNLTGNVTGNLTGNVTGNASSATSVNVNQNVSSNALYPLVWSSESNGNDRLSNQLRKTYPYLCFNPSSKLLQLDGALFLRPGQDTTLKIYSGKVTDAKSDGFIKLQTCIDGQDGETHDYAVNYQARCALFLQPRGGEVYVGKDIIAASTEANKNYKLNVGGAVLTDGNIYIRNAGNAVGSDGTNTNIYLQTNGKYVVFDSTTFRRGVSDTNVTLGNSTYRWKSTYNIDEYIGTASGSQCHLNFDDTNKCLRFTFD